MTNDSHQRDKLIDGIKVSGKNSSVILHLLCFTTDLGSFYSFYLFYIAIIRATKDNFSLYRLPIPIEDEHRFTRQL